jgi:predicted transcriptional regulator
VERKSRVKLETILRRKRVAELHFDGMTQLEIAAEVGVSRARVWQDLEAIKEDWRSEAALSFGDRQAKEVAKVDRYEREAVAAWRRSQLPAETTETSIAADGTQGRCKRTTKGQTGDAAYLNLAQGCVDRRCKILGILKDHVSIEMADEAQGMLFKHAKRDDEDGTVLPGQSADEADRVLDAPGPTPGDGFYETPGAGPGGSPIG